MSVNAVLMRRNGAEPEWVTLHNDRPHLAQIRTLIGAGEVDVHAVTNDLAFYVDETRMRTRGGPNLCVRRLTGQTLYGDVLLCCCTDIDIELERFSSVTPAQLAGLRAACRHDKDCRAAFAQHTLAASEATAV